MHDGFGALAHGARDALRGGLGLGAVGAADLHQQPAASAGQQPQGGGGGVALADDLDQLRAQPLDGQRVQSAQVGDLVGGGVAVGEAQYRHRAGARGLDQVHGGPEHGRAAAFGADQGAGEVESVLGQQLVEVVARHPAPQVGEGAADQFAEVVAQRAQVLVEPSGAVAPRAQRGELVLGGGAGLQAGAVGEQHVQRADVVDGLAPGHRVGAAGVVADHAAERAAAVGGGVGPEGQPVRGRLHPQGVQHHAGLHPRQAAFGVEFEDPVHVLGEVQHQARAHGVAGDAGARAAAGDRHPVRAGHRDRGGDVVFVARVGHRRRDLPVVGGVGGVQGAGARVEPGRSPQRRAQVGGEVLRGGLHLRSRGVVGTAPRSVPLIGTVGEPRHGGRISVWVR